MKLYLVPTPIGNLDDITLRAVKTLQGVDIVLAEDTRTTGILLAHLGLKKTLMAHHAHNEHASAAGVVKMIREGKTVALCSDAGTPGISDPGFLLVRECLRSGVPIECLPGPTAFVPALVNSGLPTDRFAFEGFLPQKKGRQTRLARLKEEPRTMVFYESPHRLLKTLENFVETFGPNRPASVSRELTKVFEETVRGSLSQIHAHYVHHSASVRGEIAIVVGGA